MTTLEEQGKLRKEVQREEKERQAAIQSRLKNLASTSITDLILLREHWVNQRRQNRKLDSVSMDRRREALIWIEVIDKRIEINKVPQEVSLNDDLNIKAAAEYLHVSLSKLYKMTSKKEVIFYKVGKNIWFKKPDLDAFLERKGKAKTADQLNKEAVKHLADYPLQIK